MHVTMIASAGSMSSETCFEPHHSTSIAQGNNTSPTYSKEPTRSLGTDRIYQAKIKPNLIRYSSEANHDILSKRHRSSLGLSLRTSYYLLYLKQLEVEKAESAAL